MAENSSIPQISAPDAAAWREWLAANHESANAVWLVFFKKGSGRPSVVWEDAVDEALCFGWIDSKVQRIDDISHRQFWTRRKPNSVWSKINKDKIRLLTDEGRMAPAGLASVAVAKENGSWTIMEGPDAGVIPEDLDVALAAAGPNAEATFAAFSSSVKRAALYWLVSAKRPETRARRIADIADRAAAGKKPTPLSND
jgi:uncharacterized protein YdeI (YjbR/CyaY-like superfamily)